MYQSISSKVAYSERFSNKVHASEPLVGPIIVLGKTPQERDFLLDSKVKWSAPTNFDAGSDVRKTGFMEPVFENSMAAAQLQYWSPSPSLIESRSNGRNQRNITSLSQLINQPDQLDSNSFTERPSIDQVTDSTQWVHSATTTARPAYDQIPRPVLFQDADVSDEFEVDGIGVPMKN